MTAPAAHRIKRLLSARCTGHSPLAPDPSGPRPYPLNPLLVNVSGADALTPAQVAPVVPPPVVPPTGGYNSNFFSGRVYDPQALSVDERTVTIVFAGYNTPQPSNSLGDYRTIGRSSCNSRPAICVAPIKTNMSGVVRAGARSTPSLC
jgi:hypothetical protein